MTQRSDPATWLSPAVPGASVGIGTDVIIHGSTIVTMDPDLGDFEMADIRIVDGIIAAVGSNLIDDFDGPVIDGRELIIAPGFQDTHRHAWQGVFRRLIPNVDDNEAYVRMAHTTLAELYQPEDMRIGNKLTALGCIDAGITTLMDFSHNSRTDAHADAAVIGLAESKIRAVHANCGPVKGDFSHRWPADLERLTKVVEEESPEGRITLRMGLLGLTDIGGPDISLNAERIEIARALGIGVSVDAVLGLESSQIVEDLGKRGILGPDTLLIHCTDISDSAWSSIAESGAPISLAPTSDAQIGIAAAIPPIQKALDFGIEPSLSVDVEIALTTDMFSQMRMILTTQRMMAFNDRYNHAPAGATGGFDELGVSGFADGISARDVLRYATLNGAVANGISATTGSLTPGKKADLIGIRRNDVNNMPFNSAIGTLVSGADVGNIELVMVDGEPLKWAGRLLSLDLDQLRREVYESRDRLLREAGMTLDLLSA